MKKRLFILTILLAMMFCLVGFSSKTTIKNKKGTSLKKKATVEKSQDPYEDAYAEYEKKDKAAKVNLKPRQGEFYAPVSDSDDPFGYKNDPEGTVYGYECDLTGGCSVWCAIDDYKYDVSATSYLAPIGKNKYDPENIANRDRMNAWVEGVKGDGIGESITISRTYRRGGDVDPDKVTKGNCFFFPNICIVNGLAKNDDVWAKNGRVKELGLYFNDEYICTLELKDTPKPQYISLEGLGLAARNGEECEFTFEIEDVYKGTKYDDTAITGIEIEVYTPNH